MQQVDQILELFEGRGRRNYGGEDVSQLEHALQTAHRAEQSGAPDWLVVAALLHDVGHLLEDPAWASAGAGHAHELRGARFVAPLFGRPIARAIALHVKAKRYLCAVEPGYHDSLSPASVRSLGRQGGGLSPEEVQAFERQPYHREAVQLRRWDDCGKIVGRRVPELERHRQRLEAAHERAAAGD